MEVDPQAAGDPSVNQRLIQGLIGIFEVDVFSHDGNIHASPGVLNRLNDLLPFLQPGRPRPDIQKLDDLLIQPFLMEKQRDLVDGFHVFGGDDRVLLHVAEKGDLGFDLRGEKLFRAADQDVGLDADLPQLHDAVLGGFGLQLFGGFDKRNQGHVDVNGILPPQVRLELADGLQEG